MKGKREYCTTEKHVRTQYHRRWGRSYELFSALCTGTQLELNESKNRFRYILLWASTTASHVQKERRKKKQSTHFQWHRHVCHKLHNTCDGNIIALSVSSIACDSNNILFKSHEIRTSIIPIPNPHTTYTIYICRRDILLCAKLKSPHAMTLWNFPFEWFHRIRYTKMFWIHVTDSEEVRVRKMVECIGLCIGN